MTFTREGDKVTLEMTIDDWQFLLLMLGWAGGSVSKDEPKLFWRCIAFINELNRTNPRFVRYEIPEGFRK